MIFRRHSGSVLVSLAVISLFCALPFSLLLIVQHMCSLLSILIKPRARDVTPDNKFIFLVLTTKNLLSKNFVLVSITVSKYF